MYKFLPFRFSQRTNGVLLTNEVGNYHFMSKNDFNSFVQKKLNEDSRQFFDLKSKCFLYNGFLSNIIEIQATQFRTKHQFLYNFTSLHMFVVTLRCNQRCSYCHASSQSEDSGAIYDMDKETAIKSVEIAFQSPSPAIKIEFQGGEPLLNFDIVKIIVEHAQRLNEIYNKELEFVICTNLVSRY
jgi:sulfatase maturation enzyme AslB (radical SAM superfamily)